MPMNEGSDMEPGNGCFRASVFSEKDSDTVKLLSIREYCLTLYSLRSDDWDTIAELKRRVRKLEGLKAR